MFNRVPRETKSMKGTIVRDLKDFAKRAFVFLMSFLIAMQTIPFSMFDMSTYAETAGGKLVSVNVVSNNGHYHVFDLNLQAVTDNSKNGRLFAKKDGTGLYIRPTASSWGKGGQSKTISLSFTQSGYYINPPSGGSGTLSWGTTASCSNYLGSLNPSSDYILSGTGTKNIYAKVNLDHDYIWQKVGNAPSGTTNYTYGSTRSFGTISGVNRSGNTGSFSSVGSYSCTYTPDSGHCWDNGSRSSSTQYINITPASNSMSINTYNRVYNGESQTLISSASRTQGTMYFRVQAPGDTDYGGWTTDSSTIKGKNAGTYKIQYYAQSTSSNYYNSSTYTKTLTLAKAPGSASVTGATDLLYSGTNQHLLTDGTGIGTMHYRVSEADSTSTWSGWTDNYNDIMGNMPGIYTIQYYSDETDNYEATTTASTTVEIARLTPKISVTGKEGLSYTGMPQQLVNTASVEGNGTIHYRVTGANNDSYGGWTDKITDITGQTAGKYKIQYYSDQSTLHKAMGSQASPYGTIEVDIAKIDPPTFTVTGKTGLSYTGLSQELIDAATVTGGGTIHYRVTGANNSYYGDWTTNASDITGTGAGTYKIQYYSDTSTNYLEAGSQTSPKGTIEVNIAKVKASKTNPTAKNGLIYNGTNQNLVNAGTSTHGTYYYWVSDTSNTPGEDDSGWSTTVPTLKNVGSKYIWYKFVADSDHIDVGVNAVGKVSIGKKALMITAEDKTITYGAAVPTWTYSAPDLEEGDSLGTVTYTIKDSGEEVVSPSTSTDVGEYTIVPSGASNSNYNISYTNGTWTINKATATKTNPTAKTGLEYDESSQKLLNAGSSNHGTYYYYCSTTNTTPTLGSSGWSTAVPEQTVAKTYYVWYKFVGDKNHNDVGVTSLDSVVISKVDATFSVNPEAKSNTNIYNRSGQVLFNEGTVKYSNTTAEYAVSTSNSTPPVTGWSETVPAVTDVNTYYLWARINTANASVNKKDAYYTNLTKAIIKADNPITAPADQDWDATFYKTSQSKDFTGFSGQEGTLTYSIFDVMNNGESVKSSNYFAIDSNTGKLTITGGTMPGTYTVTVQGSAAGNSNFNQGTNKFDITVVVTDKTAPTAAVSATDNRASTQTVTLTGTDDIAITKYYFGTDISGNPDKDWGETNTEIADKGAIYYLITQDKAGNNSEPAQIEFYKSILNVSEDAIIELDSVLTEKGKSFYLPAITPPQGFHVGEEDVWQVGDTDQFINNEGKYTPTGNFTLTGRLIPNPLEFDNQGANFEGSADIQYMPIKPARQGTGNYTYSIKSQPAGNYFRVVDNSKIEIPLKVPNGTFILTVHVYDEKSKVFADAKYVISMKKKPTVIELDSESLELTYPVEGKFKVTDNKSGGNVSVTTNDPAIATAEVSEDQKNIIVKPGVEEGTVTLDVEVEATAFYSSVLKQVNVTVHLGKFEIEGIPETASADGQLHYASIKSDLPGVTVRYGEGAYNRILKIASADTSYKLTGSGRKDVGTSTINYKATCPGYETEEGQTTVTIIDNQRPTGEITDVTTKLKNSQTVTLKAEDNDRIAAYYFGKESTGNPQPIDKPTANFEKEKVDVAEGPGTYYFIVKDVKGNIETVATIDFYATTFAVDFGRTNLDTVLLKVGEEFSLPTITASTGYKSENVKWEISGNGTQYAQEETYKPLATETLKAKCTEITAELSYDNNEHGTEAPGAQTMWYTKEATAAPAMENIDGYTFKGWNTDPDGKGTYVAAGGTVKNDHVIPVDTVLYAIWEKNELEFEDQTFDNLTTSTVDQTVDIKGASKGTGDYDYEVLVQAGNYFEADNSNDTIIISASIPAGDYVITVQALDNGSGKTAVATYKFTLKRMSYAISLDKNVVSMLTTSAETIPVNNPSGGDLIVEIDNQSLITAVISNGSLAITPMGIIGTATVTVTAKETGYYESATTTCTVTVDKVRTLYGGFENVSNDRADNQSMTLHVTCEDKIIGVYFGKDSNGETVDLETPATEYTKPVTVDEAGTYYLIAADNLGRTEIIDTVTFYRTRFSVPNGDTAIYGVLTKAGSSFFLPEISANPGYLAPTLWSNAEGDKAPRAEYFPTSNTDFSATCTLKQEEELPADLSIAVTGKSLSVGSDLAVNFYFAIPKEIQGGEMTFEIEHSDQEQVIEGEDKSQGIRYCYKINVNQMSDGITWEYEKDGKTWESDTDYSFYDYLNTATDGLDSSNQKLADFANKLKTYGYYAQNYLASYDGIEHFKIGEKYEAIPVPTFDPTETDLSGYVISADGTDDNIDTSNILQSLVLDNVISMKLYIPTTCTNATELDITVDGAPVESGNVRITESGHLEIVVPKISATKLADVHTITVNEVTIKASAMAYANKLKQDSDTLAQKLGAALYDLYQSAVDYRK